MITFLLIVIGYMLLALVANIAIRCSGIFDNGYRSDNENLVLTSLFWPVTVIGSLGIAFIKGFSALGEYLTNKICPNKKV